MSYEPSQGGLNLIKQGKERIENRKIDNRTLKLRNFESLNLCNFESLQL